MSRKHTMTLPDDWHLHVRDGAVLSAVIGHTAAQFGRAMIMPNLVPPVTTVERAESYRQEILDALPDDASLNPLMSLYLTDNTPIDSVAAAARSPHVVGFKLYPAGATTNSDSGVTSIHRVMPVLESMAEHGVVLQVHGEVTDHLVDVFDREAVFIEQVLEPVCREIPELKVILEHVTTSHGVDFVRQSGPNTAATITVHHLMYSRNDLFRGGIRPHYYCLPILKRRQHQEALVAAAISGDPAFFLGTDSAPHYRGLKENACGCAGIYTAHAALELYAEVFDGMESLDKLEGFASHHGADFYGLPRNSGTITLEQRETDVPASFPIGADARPDDPMTAIVPLRAGENVAWRISRS